MAGQNWRKNKKGVLVNSEGKTALEVRLDKYATKLKARKEMLAAKKAEAKAKASGGGGGREQELEKLKNDRRSEQNLANDKYNAGLAKETADWMATRRPGKKRPKISKAFKEWEKTTDAIEEKYNKLTAAIEEKYSPAKPASKGKAEAKASGGGGGASTSPSASGGEGEFTKKTVSLKNREGKARKVEGEVLGDYVISAGGNDAYSIHHVPTGLEITSSVGFKTRNPAKYESLSEKEAARLAVRKLVDAKIDIPDSYSKWDKSSTDKKAKIGQAIVDAFDDKNTPAKPASRRPNKKISNRGD